MKDLSKTSVLDEYTRPLPNKKVVKQLCEIELGRGDTGENFDSCNTSADYFCWNCDQPVCETHRKNCERRGHEVQAGQPSQADEIGRKHFKLWLRGARPHVGVRESMAAAAREAFADIADLIHERACRHFSDECDGTLGCDYRQLEIEIRQLAGPKPQQGLHLVRQ